MKSTNAVIITSLFLFHTRPKYSIKAS